MNWLKGLVAPAAQLGVQQQQQGTPYGADAPPIGGVQPPMQAPMQPAPFGAPAGMPAPMEWSVGTRTQGASQAASLGTAAPASEARLAQLQHDVESLALFARTLLTMLEEAKVVTRAQFEETKKRLDMLDGKLDDR